MVKVIMPLCSSEARGTIAGFLTFSMRASGAQVRYQKKQKDVITEARTAQREKFITSKDWWHELTDEEQEEWNILGNS